MTSPRTVDDKLDDAGAFPEIRRLRKAVNAGVWKPVAQAFATLTDDHSLSVGLKSAAEVAGSERLFKAAMKPEEGTLPQLLLAARHIELAWYSRGHGRAATLTVAQYAAFRDRLVQAEQLLIDVCAVEPENVPAWELRLTTAMGLELDPSEAQRRWDQLVARNPHQYTAEFRRLQMLCPKWGGTWDQAFDFARTAAADAEPGSLTPALIPTVHLERWWATEGDGVALLSAKEVQSEVSQAAQNSVLHKDFRKTYRWVQAQGTFALYYSLVGRRQQAAAHFRQMGTLGSRYPWGWFADPVGALTLHRNRALPKE